MKRTRVLPTVLIASTLLLTGCGGNTSVTNTGTTMGQELQDLEEARKENLISEEEYNKARKSILERYQ